MLYATVLDTGGFVRAISSFCSLIPLLLVPCFQADLGPCMGVFWENERLEMLFTELPPLHVELP